MPPAREEVETAKDAPEPDPEPPVLSLEEAPVTPAHPFNTTTDAASNTARRYLPPFVRNRLWSRADMSVIPFMNRRTGAA